MTLAELTPILIALMASIPGIVSLYFAWRKNKSDVKLSDADVAAKFERLAASAADASISKSKRIEELETKVDKIEDLEKAVARLSWELEQEKKARIEAEKRAILFEDWSARLVIQLSRANMNPVPLRVSQDEK